MGKSETPALCLWTTWFQMFTLFYSSLFGGEVAEREHFQWVGGRMKIGSNDSLTAPLIAYFRGRIGIKVLQIDLKVTKMDGYLDR